MVTITSNADEAQIVIKQKIGGNTILELSTNPVITLTNESLVVTNDFTVIAIPFDNIDSYVVTNGTAGISQPEEVAHYVNGHVLFSNLPIGSVVNVFTIDGLLISRQFVDDTGKADICLDALPKNNYIISSFYNKIKVINK